MEVILFLYLVTLLSVNAAISSSEGSYKMPTECENQTYCTKKGRNYPTDEKLKEAIEYWELNQPHRSAPEFSQRDGERLHMNCRGQYENATIYWIVNNNKVTLPVIQLEGYFQQTIELRYCKENGDSNCNEANLKFLNAPLSCHNEYMFFDFLTISSSGEVQLSQAEVPVCCKCTIKY